ncbi:hypothetical protein Tco_1015328 [Tanacetum coccineum]|uniref:Uncharacterized protein n=1 Tax=Tanacetum coccineum TaxID=301880 RepID=A0ABQ5FLL0_9ASTR
MFKGLKQLVDEYVDEGVFLLAKPSLEDSDGGDTAKGFARSLTRCIPNSRGSSSPSCGFQVDEEMPSVGRSGNQDGGQAGSDHGTLDEGQAGSDLGTRDEGQAGSNPGTLDEGQAGSGPGTRDEGQAGPNPDDTNIAESLPLPNSGVLAGPSDTRKKILSASTGTLASLQTSRQRFSALVINSWNEQTVSRPDNEKTKLTTEVLKSIGIPSYSSSRHSITSPR